MKLYVVKVRAYNQNGILQDEETGEYVCSSCGEFHLGKLRDLVHKHNCPLGTQRQEVDFYFDYSALSSDNWRTWKEAKEIVWRFLIPGESIARRILADLPNLRQYVDDPIDTGTLLVGEITYWVEADRLWVVE